jgi:hypothetical protein
MARCVKSILLYDEDLTDRPTDRPIDVVRAWTGRSRPSEGRRTTTENDDRERRRRERARGRRARERINDGIVRALGARVDVREDDDDVDDDVDDDSRRSRGHVVDVDDAWDAAWLPRRIRGETRARERAGDEDSGGVTTERVFVVVVVVVVGRGIALERVRDEETDERRAKANGRG